MNPKSGGQHRSRKRAPRRNCLSRRCFTLVDEEFSCTKSDYSRTYAPGKIKFNSSSHGMDPDRSEMRAMLVVGGPSAASGKEVGNSALDVGHM